MNKLGLTVFLLLLNIFGYSSEIFINLDNKNEINIKYFDFFYRNENIVNTKYINKTKKDVKVISVETNIYLPFNNYKEKSVCLANYKIPKNEFTQPETIQFSLDKLIDYSKKNIIKSNYFYCYKIFAIKTGVNKIEKKRSNQIKAYFNIELIKNIQVINSKYFRFYVYKPFLDNEENKTFFEKYKDSADKSYEYFEVIFGFKPSNYNNFISVFLLPDIAFCYTSGGLKGIYISIAQLLPKDFNQTIDYKIYDKYFTFSHELTHYFLYEFGMQPSWIVENFANYFALNCEYYKYPIEENRWNWDFIKENIGNYDAGEYNFINYDLDNPKMDKSRFIWLLLKELEELCGEDIWKKIFKSMKDDNYKFYDYLSQRYNDNIKTKEFIDYIQRNTDKNIIDFFNNKGYKYK